MGKAFYRKYRSRSLDEIIGQEHITKTLNEAIKKGRISHAYLLTGPRGVGKTSIARILAHEINNLPYSDDSTHIDIIEIDAASNRRIDEIRELRDKVNIAPTSAKYKVYIIDEVHMLTKEAFNALLKTLEEPPVHAVFILATTDAHKLPDTIISRTQRYNFKPVQKSKVADHLRTIAKYEKLDVSDDALALLAEHGEGSFRDSISMLDQASSHSGKLELADVQQLLGIPPNDSVNRILKLVSTGNSAELINELNTLFGEGFQASTIAKQLANTLRSQLIDDSIPIERANVINLLEQLLKVPASGDPDRFLEICLLEALTAADSHKPIPKDSTEIIQAVSEPEEITQVVMRVKETPAPVTNFDDSIWSAVLTELKKKHNTLYGVVRMAEPTIGDDGIKLAFAFGFHQKRSSESANRQKIADIVRDLTGKEVNIECVLDADANPPKVTITSESATKPADNPNLSTISNIFGDAELLES